MPPSSQSLTSSVRHLASLGTPSRDGHLRCWRLGILSSWYQRRMGQPCGFFSQQHADLDLAMARGLNKDQPQQRVERERVYPKAGALGCNLLPQAPDSSWVFPGPEMAPHNKQPKRKVETQQMTMWKPKYLNLLLFTPQASAPPPGFSNLTDPHQHYCPKG